MAAARKRARDAPPKVKKGSGAILVEPRSGPAKGDPDMRRMLAALERLSELGPYKFKKLKP